ncbi:MAG: hypothetical protein E6049_05525 [Varibaculum cambriense]|nr:hypothetical protein [Varibaculum cambriense]
MTNTSTAPLAPGETSIDRVKPFQTSRGWGLRWRARLHDGTTVSKYTTGKTKGIVRQRAKAKAAELMATPGHGRWTPQSRVVEYMEEVVKPAIEASRLASETSRRYGLAYRLLLGQCRAEGCQHKHALAGKTIHQATRPRALSECLEEIARLHGAKNVKHARLVASHYLMKSLKTDELIEHNPLTDINVDLSEARTPERRRGGVALTEDEYRKAIAWLMTARPQDAPRPRRGRWTHQHAITARAAALDLILLQATTGLRTSEAARRTPEDCHVDQHGTFIVTLTGSQTKTRRGRPVPVLVPEVSHRLTSRLEATEPGQPLFPASTDPAKHWQPRTRDRALASLYCEMAEALDLPVFEFERGHLWRATLNTLLYDALPEATRVRLLGHTEAVNRSHYTAVTSTDSVVRAAAFLSENATDDATDVSVKPSDSR